MGVQKVRISSTSKFQTHWLSKTQQHQMVNNCVPLQSICSPFPV